MYAEDRYVWLVVIFQDIKLCGLSRLSAFAVKYIQTDINALNCFIRRQAKPYKCDGDCIELLEIPVRDYSSG